MTVLPGGRQNGETVPIFRLPHDEPNESNTGGRFMVRSLAALALIVATPLTASAWGYGARQRT